MMNGWRFMGEANAFPTNDVSRQIQQVRYAMLEHQRT
ncbi:hypothetical protein SPAN111604_09465 [Sphingomonas antarctica]